MSSCECKSRTTACMAQCSGGALAVCEQSFWSGCSCACVQPPDRSVYDGLSKNDNDDSLDSFLGNIYINELNSLKNSLIKINFKNAQLIDILINDLSTKSVDNVFTTTSREEYQKYFNFLNSIYTQLSIEQREKILRN